MTTASTNATAGIRAATILLASSALLSRFLGFGREVLLAYLYGATGTTDVYRASFTVPDLLNYLLAGGALTIAFIPRMTELYARAAAVAEDSGDPAAPVDTREVDRVFGIVASSMLAMIIALTIVAEIFTEPLVRVFVSGFSAEKLAQTVHLTRIVLPAQVCFIYGSLVQGNLLARQVFSARALTPVLYNLGIIVGGVIGALSGDISGFSWGALVGAFIGAAVVPTWIARKQLSVRLTMPSLHPEVRSFLWVFVPLMLGVSLLTVDEWAGRRFGSYLPDGSISWLDNARRVMMVPVGLAAVGAGQATASFVARLWAQGDAAEVGKLITASVRGVVGVAMVIAGFFAAMPEPIIGLLFERGAFGHIDTVRTAAALVPFAVAIVPFAVMPVLNQSLFSTGYTWVPMLVTTALTAASIPLYQALSSLGIRGLATAGAIGMTVQCCAIAILAQRRLGLDMRALLSAVARGLVTAGLAGVAASVTDHFTNGALAETIPLPWLAYAVRLAAAAAAWALVVLLVGQAVDLPGLHEVSKRIRRRLARR